ncbi:MAG: hypothetical protein L6Q95_19760 [Planctomycetes bacterium]|nr:hypothetical protein [Planctomycetota bacterium]
MKPILLLSLVGALAAPAAAGDVSIGFGYSEGHGVSIGFGYREKHRHHDHGRRHVEHRKWVPGHYETVHRQVYVPGWCEQVWQPAEYRWTRDHCGRRVRVLVRPAGYVTVERPGYYKTVCEQVWVPGRYVRC